MYYTHYFGENVTSAGWQVTLCDPMWHVSSRSGVATLWTAIQLLLITTPPSVIHSDMVYDPEYTTGLYQRETQTLWAVTSSSECYIWTHTD